MPSPIAGLLPLSVVLLVVASRSQRPLHTDDSELKRLALDLGDSERSAEAVRVLSRRGAPAVAALTGAIRDSAYRSDARRLATAIYTLGKLGDDAAPAARLLVVEARTATGDVLRNVYWALGEIGPKAEADGAKVLAELADLTPDPGWAHQEWSFACRRLDVGLDTTPHALEHLLRLRDHPSLVAAAGLLCRLDPGATVPRTELLAAWEHVAQGWRAHGEGWSRVARELARAVVRHAPDAPGADAARAALVGHFDLDVRLDAVMKLGQTPPDDPEMAVAALITALADGSVFVRREALTSLGLLGPAAAAAVPTIGALVEDADTQIRVRAAAALRAIR